MAKLKQNESCGGQDPFFLMLDSKNVQTVRVILTLSQL
jgi:hypothetical protein